VNNRNLFWFRTRQSLLSEWGYLPGAWHLIKRTRISITVLGVNAQGRPVLAAGKTPHEIDATRVTLALIDVRQSDLVGPFTLDELPRPPEFEPALPSRRM
jgi:hypothetical protein